MSTTTCPVFYPTIEEFKDFYNYIISIEDKLRGQDAGICKIIPPNGWLNQQYDIDKIQLKVDYPVKQVVTGRAGIFTVNLLELKPMVLSDFLKYSKQNNCNNDNNEVRERKFWKSLGGCGSQWEDPIYGADVVGSLFDHNQASNSWNVNKLDSLLRLLPNKIPGVNSAMLYVGTWRSMFAFHVEDMDLYSINYLHSGYPKSWYSVNHHNKIRFENLSQSYFGLENKSCKEYLRHKTKLFSPMKLSEQGIPYTTALQQPGEFIITLPGAYHAGFNHGFNLAEATNFATPKWLSIGKQAKPCVCRPSAVSIDVDFIETLFIREIIKNNNMRYLTKSLSSLDSDSSILSNASYLNDYDINSDRIRCFCKQLRRITNIDSNSDTYKCKSCLATCHVNCLESYHPGICSTLCCDLCYSIDVKASALILPSTKSKSIKRKSNESTTSNEITPSPTKTSRKRITSSTSFKVGDSAYAILPGYLDEVIGSIVAIEENQGRIHVKGVRRDNDMWVDLNSLRSVNNDNNNDNDNNSVMPLENRTSISSIDNHMKNKLNPLTNNPTISTSIIKSTIPTAYENTRKKELIDNDIVSPVMLYQMYQPKLNQILQDTPFDTILYKYTNILKQLIEISKVSDSSRLNDKICLISSLCPSNEISSYLTSLLPYINQGQLCTVKILIQKFLLIVLEKHPELIKILI